MAEAKITYRAKDPTKCPLCGHQFYHEVMHTGGGRMNAANLSDELHRGYNPSQKYGAVYPLLYPVVVCPQCWYAAYPKHFMVPGSMSKDMISTLQKKSDERKKMIRPLFDHVDFKRDRTLAEGISSYVLAAACYDEFPKTLSPSFYRGLSFLRAGWLARDINTVQPNEHYDYMAEIFLRKASFFYYEVLIRQEEGSETLEDVTHYGPDIDTNFGFDGVLYLIGVLQLKYGGERNSAKRAAILKSAQTTVSKIVGFGEFSKGKPSVLLDLGRELYNAIKKELQALG
ncbi:MAG: hypothetical protein B0D92_07885 [Spirochaeta sp. LUC14_002_19_P3]|nr:MAG: hypothetical protein B0D92_07885 [Spirochaeta sp. LUC14_002_19_P3]